MSLPIAIRALEDREKDLRVGDKLGPSEIWLDHRPTGKYLSGVCAFDARLDPIRALRRAESWPISGTRRRYAVLAGEVVQCECDGERTIEFLEVVVRDAVVLEMLETRSGRVWSLSRNCWYD